MSAAASSVERLSALPDSWSDQWGTPSPANRQQLAAFKAEFESLARDVVLEDGEDRYGDLVHPSTNRQAPLHRWFTYKEAFAAELPRRLVQAFTVGESGVVLDPFAGVATTQLSLQSFPGVAAAHGVEWSPLAHLVGRAKTSWPRMSLSRIERAIADVSRFRPRKNDDPPGLAAFTNPEIFDASTVAALVAARRRIEELDVDRPTRDFLLLGLAAIVEDSSGVMKDGRALRIARDRVKRSTSLADDTDSVRDRLRLQYAAMLEDLRAVRATLPLKGLHPVSHRRGDARQLHEALGAAIEPGGVGLALYSPPYLNCIDHTEVYKLELWLLGLIRDQRHFRETRLGTLRSHPSIDFPPRGFVGEILGRRRRLAFIVRGISTFLERNHSGSGIGKMVANYFDDMTRVLQQQYLYLEPGGHAVCVVANSTFSRRDMFNGRRYERWRLPILTDVLLAHIGTSVGFAESYIVRARDLRPRNVTAGAARESLVAFRK